MENIRTLSKAYIQEITQKLITERNEVPAPDFKLDEFQQKLINSDSKFIRVIAPAGSGKTRTLLAKAVDELKADDKAQILCLTFTNAAVREFNNQAQGLDNFYLNRLEVSTLNAFGYGLLKKVNPDLRIVAPNKKGIGTVYFHIKNLMAENKKIKRKNNETYPTIFELADLTKALGFDHELEPDETEIQFAHIVELGFELLLQKKLDEIELNGNTKDTFLKIWFPFWQELTNKLWDSNFITIEDQKYWALNQLTYNDTLIELLKNKNITHILIDEFQDINLLDLFLILQIAIIASASVIIVGDDDQCIYEWRGCTSKIIQKPDYYFKAIIKSQNFKSIELSKNYRCPRNIVIHSSKLIETNKHRILKKMIPAKQEDANIRVIPLPAAYLTLNVVDELVADIEKKHPKHTVAIVGRKKCQLIPVQILLTRRGTRFSVDTDLNVFESEAFKTFRNFLGLPPVYFKKRKPNKNIDDFFSLVDRVKKYVVNKNEKAAISRWLTDYNPESLKDAVDMFGWYDGKFKGGFVEPKDVAEELDHFLSQKTVVSALNVASEIFKGLQKDFLKSKDDIFYSDPPFSHLADLAVGYDTDFKSFLRDIDKTIERASENDPRNAKIELMTALRTKGREFDTVIVLDVNDGIWPNKLSKEAGRIEEERRLFYVTVTRSKNNLLLFESGRVQGHQLYPSPFVSELELPADAWLRLPEYNKISSELLDQLKI
jgi:DNA helicase II / ATP-dependent DNA helicase PcrA